MSSSSRRSLCLGRCTRFRLLREMTVEFSCFDHAKVNIFNLAKTAGTSVEQIERVYARDLPLSKELARNLQEFGGQ